MPVGSRDTLARSLDKRHAAKTELLGQLRQILQEMRRSDNGDDDDYEAALLEVQIAELQLYTHDLFVLTLSCLLGRPLSNEDRARFFGFD